MTAANHALTGAIIGLSLHQPVVAVPLAFSAHYLMDAIPHFGGVWPLGSRAFLRYLAVETGLCVGIVLALFVLQPSYWWLGATCAFATASPDFMWVGKFLAARSGKALKEPKHWLVRLHKDIQWFERPIGWVVEVAWAVGALSLLANIVAS